MDQMATRELIAEEPAAQITDWEELLSDEGRRMRMPTLQNFVARFAGTEGLIGMHGGLPPPAAFPFSGFEFDLAPGQRQAQQQTQTQQQTQQHAAAAAAAAGEEEASGQGGTGPPAVPAEAAAQHTRQLAALRITDPVAVATAQQYIMQPKGYPPLQAWAQQLVQQLHRPAALQRPGCATGFELTLAPGASAALDALARVLLNPGDPVLVEEFSYNHHIDTHLLTRGCEVLPVSMDGEGLLPDHLDHLLTQRQADGKKMPRVLYTIPTGQNPTGATMSRGRMAQVYALARKWGVVIIEDDAYYFLQYPHGPDSVPGLAGLKPGFLSLDVDGRVVRVDTFAKLLGPGFRLGWVSGPAALVSKVSLHIAAVSVGCCSFSQVVLHQLLQAWGPAGFEGYVQQLQRLYARQAAAAAAAAARHLAGVAEWQPVTAGMFMWMRLTDGSDASFLLEAGVDHRVMVVPGYLVSVHHLQLLACQHYQQQQQKEQQQQPGGTGAAEVAAAAASDGRTGPPPLPPCPFFRVSFASVAPQDLEEGFARLRRAIDSRRQRQ